PGLPFWFDVVVGRIATPARRPEAEPNSELAVRNEGHAPTAHRFVGAKHRRQVHRHNRERGVVAGEILRVVTRRPTLPRLDAAPRESPTEPGAYHAHVRNAQRLPVELQPEVELRTVPEDALVWALARELLVDLRPIRPEPQLEREVLRTR